MENSYKVLKGCKLIDGTGAAPVEDSVMVIKNDTIEAVGTSGSIDYPRAAVLMNADGKTVMPGLIDAHLHLFGLKEMSPAGFTMDSPQMQAIRGVKDVWRLIDAGFTTVRDCCCVNGIMLRNAVNEGSITGPRILASGRAISQTAGHGDVHYRSLEWAGSEKNFMARLADGVSEVRKAAREQLRMGADFLKIMTTGGVLSEKDVSTASQYSIEEIKAFVEEANNWGCLTATHAQGTRGIKTALKCGVNSIEHGFYLDDECIDLMIKQKSFLVPTLVVVDLIANKGAEAGVPEVSVNKAKIAQKAHLCSFEKAYKAGVICGLGTDHLGGPMSPHGTNAMELDLYVKRAGLTPMEAIVCATKNNAAVLGISDEIGTLEPGKKADFLVIEGDPSQDIEILCDRNKIIMVYKDGKKVPRLEPESH